MLKPRRQTLQSDRWKQRNEKGYRRLWRALDINSICNSKQAYKQESFLDIAPLQLELQLVR